MSGYIHSSLMCLICNTVLDTYANMKTCLATENKTQMTLKLQ